MSLVPHKITALEGATAAAISTGKTTVPSAVVIIYDSDNNAITLYDDAAFSNPSTAKSTDSNGELIVWVTAGEYTQSVNGSTALPVTVGGASPFTVDTFANLILLSPEQTGQEFTCQERASALYILKAAGYTALDGDATFANSRVAALQVKGINKLGFYSNLQEAFSRGGTIDMTGYGDYALTSQITVANDINIVCRDDSKITGYDGLGILFSGSNIKLNGFNVSGFYDGTDTNESNFGTAFIRIATGTTVNSILVNGGSNLNCRSVIRGTGTSSDTAVDATINIKKIKIKVNTIDGCPLAYYFRCTYNDVYVDGNTCINAIGASKGLTPYTFYLDGVGNDAAVYKAIGNVRFTNNYANTIVNRTTTGDSSGGNSYESHLLKASGEKIIIKGNIVNDCTGTNTDCEAFYTKARYTLISNNVLIDAGSNEAAINAKGIASDSPTSDTSPFGEYVNINNNMVVFTRSSYDNNGTTVALDTVGIHAAVPSRFNVSNNTIIGANANDIVLDGTVGPATQNSTSIVSGNISDGTSGLSSIKYRGAFKRTKAFGNICSNVKADGKSFSMFSLLSVNNRGVTNKANEFTNNLLTLGDATSNESGFVHSFITIDAENYNYDTLIVNSNTIDIQTTDASARPIYVTKQTSGFTGTVSKLIVKYNNFLNKDYVLGPCFFDVLPLSYDLDIEYDWTSTANTAQNAILLGTANLTNIDAEIRVFSTRTDVRGAAQRDISNFIGYTASGTLTAINNTAESAVGNASGIGVTLAVIENDLRVRISGEDSQTWNHNIKFKVASR